MNLYDLESLIAGAPWFNRLGCFVAHDGFIAITEQEAWRDHTAACVAAEFGTSAPTPQPSNDLHVLMQMDWLPSSQSDVDPFHHDELHAQIAAQGDTDVLRRNRSRFSRLLTIGMRDLKPSDWLHVGPTDYTEAARQASIFALRMAVAEIMAQRQGIWCDCVGIYVGGNWPCGRLPTGQIVVL